MVAPRPLMASTRVCTPSTRKSTLSAAAVRPKSRLARANRARPVATRNTSETTAATLSLAEEAPKNTASTVGCRGP